MNQSAKGPIRLIRLVLLLAVAICLLPLLARAATSQWAYYGPQGHLVYGILPSGDHIMDFSSAGYGGGGVAIPTVLAVKTVAPSGGDDTAAIQSAIDEASRLPLTNGFRGAVLLNPGAFNVSQTIEIRSSGVVLRGSGSGADGTTINMTGKPHLCFRLGAEGDPHVSGKPTTITDPYVPSGCYCFHVADAGEFHPGDHILINRPATPAWVHFMGMDDLVRNGRSEHWVSGEMHTERTIKSVSDNLITLDIPVADSFDARYLNPPGGSIVKCTFQDRPVNIGVENLRITSPPLSVTIDEPSNQALRMAGVSDAWVRDLTVENTVNSFYFDEHTSRITVEAVDIHHAVPTIGAAKPEDFWAGGTQTLIDRCSATGDNLFYFSTGARMMGPVVVLNCTFHGNGHIQPHMRWATGLLIDNCNVPESGIDLMNRGIMGSGHGWTTGWSVAWNCTAKTFLIQRPPGSVNWAIGCRGTAQNEPEPGNPSKQILPNGIYECQGTRVTPDSLYLAQLRNRLGPTALTNIGY